MLRSPQVLAAATRPGLPPLPPLTPEENADLPRVLNLCQQDGGSYNGPVAGHFPNHPRYQRYSTLNRIQSMYLQSLNVGKRWWWFINAIDHRQARSWGVDAIQLIQTAAEMIVTFAESWETMQALQERETLLCSVNGALPSAFLFQIIHHNSGGLRQITYISPSAEHMLGRSVTELSANPYPIRDLIHPEDHARFIAADQESDRSGKPFDIEARMIKADGQIGWFHIRAEMVRMLDMQRSLWNGVAMEVTAQKEAKQALATQLRYAEALARCSRTLLIAGAAIPAWGPVVQQALAALREAVGCVRLSFNLYPSRETFLLQHAEVVANQDPTAPPHQAIPFHMEDIPPAVLATISSGGYAVGSSAVLFPEGSNARRHYDVNGVHAILLIGVLLGGQLRGYLSASDHIEGQTWGEPAIRLLRTGLEMIAAFIQQWETASALRTREAQLRALGDNLPNGYIYQLHRDQNWQPCFTYLSSGVEQVLGVRPEDGLRDPGEFYRIMLPEDVARVDVMAAHAAANGNDLKEIVRYHRANGELRWLYLCSRPRHQPNGCVVWDGVVLDITERQRAAEELARARDVAEAATQAKSAFLASMSHEIRTPLNAVIGMTAMLQDTALSAEQRFYVDTIHTGGEALLAVISDILDFSRIESGRIELEVVPFDLHACLGSTIDLIAHSARTKELFVSWTLAPEVPQVVVGDS
ncbi:MAG: PAS domain-containing protein, partial [Oscillochloris sp.]|nr:PAS domain-containing protein [Oscillochloris sp.]